MSLAFVTVRQSVDLIDLEKISVLLSASVGLP